MLNKHHATLFRLGLLDLATQLAMVFIRHYRKRFCIPHRPLAPRAKLCKLCQPLDQFFWLQWYPIMRNNLAFAGSLAPLSKCVKIYQMSFKYIDDVSKCVKLNTIIFEYDTIVDFGVQIDIFGFGHFSRYFGLERLSLKRIV